MLAVQQQSHIHWRELFSENRMLIGVAAVLLVLAVTLSLL
jgi:hypothetical protein